MPRLAIVALAICGCGSRSHAPPPPAVQVLGEVAVRSDEVPQASPWFDGKRVQLVAARGETVGVSVYHRGGPVRLAMENATVHGFAVHSLTVARPSTALYGGSRGAGDYPDELVAMGAPDTAPAYFTIVADAPGRHAGKLEVDDASYPVVLDVADVTLPSLPPRVWAYEDPRELAWAKLGAGSVAQPSDEERACIAMFRARGVLLSPDMPVAAWPARKALVDTTWIPAVISGDPGVAGDQVRAWIDATAGTGQVPFAIPIDEPGDGQATEVKMLAAAVRAAGGGPTTFRYAVTADASRALGDVDLYISLRAHAGEWTYNGAPPRAGSMVLDGLAPGLRTWGWIAWRYRVPFWYVWDAAYWRDRHNARRRKDPGFGKPLDRADAITFDDGDDHGNLDGVLALPGDAGAACRPTLRLEALRRGLEDRALLELAAACKPAETAALAAQIIPRALGEAGADGQPAWPTDDAAFEQARRKLIEYARCR